MVVDVGDDETPAVFGNDELAIVPASSRDSPYAALSHAELVSLVRKRDATVARQQALASRMKRRRRSQTTMIG